MCAPHCRWRLTGPTVQAGVEIIHTGDERLALFLDLLQELGLLGLLLLDGQRGLEFGLVFDDLFIFALQLVEIVDTKLGLGDLLVDIFLGADHVDDTVP